MDRPIDHWKLTAIGMVLVVATAVVTGLVVANWYGPERPGQQAEVAPAASPPVELPAREAPARQPIASATDQPAVKPAVQAPAPPSATAPAAPSTVPPKAVIDACNEYAARQSGAPLTTRDKTIEVVKDAAIGAVGGAAVGALGGAIADGGKGAGKGAAIGGLAGGGAGTLYGIYANKKNDERYRAAYASCTKSRGF